MLLVLRLLELNVQRLEIRVVRFQYADSKYSLWAADQYDGSGSSPAVVRSEVA